MSIEISNHRVKILDWITCIDIKFVLQCFINRRQEPIPIRKIRDLQQSAILARTIAISQNKLDNIVLRQSGFDVSRILCLRKSGINMHFAKVQIMVKFEGILI